MFNFLKYSRRLVFAELGFHPTFRSSFGGMYEICMNIFFVVRGR